MGFEHFNQKKLIIKEVEDLEKRIRELLPILAVDDRQAFIDGIKGLFGESPSVADSRERLSETEKFIPNQAVIQALMGHPEGLNAKAIIEYCSGRIKTDSSNERSIIYSSIAYLKKTGRVIQQEDKTYVLPHYL